MSNEEREDVDMQALTELIDAYIRDHHAMANMLAWCDWVGAYEDLLDRTRLFELRFKDGELVETRDITPPPKPWPPFPPAAA